MWPEKQLLERLQGEAGGGEVPPGTPQPDFARVEEDGTYQWTGNQGSLGHRMYQDPYTLPVHRQRRLPGIGYSLQDGFNQTELISRY